MKIAIFGIPCSGKDYLIDKIVKHLNANTFFSAYHLSSSTTTAKLAIDVFGVEFKQTNEEQKTVLREKFIDSLEEKAKKCDVVFVDAHYSFPKEDAYLIAATEKERLAYDAFFFLDTPSDMILNYSQEKQGANKNILITEQQINDWKQFEQARLLEVCTSQNKELIILDEDTQAVVLFMDYYIKQLSKQKHTAEYIARAILNKIDSNNLQKALKIILLDCDKTLTENDVSKDILEKLGVKWDEIKKIFSDNRFTAYQFFKINELFQSAIKEFSQKELISLFDEVYKNVKFNQTLESFLNKNNDYFPIAITAGISVAWEYIIKKNPLSLQFLGSDVAKAYIITPEVKAKVVELLQNQEKYIVAVGDSVLDIPMLEKADIGIINACGKLSPFVEKYFLDNPTSTIKQFSSNKYRYSVQSIDL